MPSPLESNPATSGKLSGESADNSERRGTRPCFLVAGALFALLVCLFWQPIQQRSLAFFLLHAEAPSEEALSTAVEQDHNRAAFLKQLWETGRLPHRVFAARYLSRVSSSNRPLVQDLESILIQASNDVDIETRQLAFSVLQTVRHPQLRRLALQQLSDADPAVRLIGLQALHGIAATNDVAIGMQMLSDPEPRVVVAAGQLLRAATGLDFGLRSSLAMPQFTFIGTDPPPQPDLAAIARGVEGWTAWWRDHKAEYLVGTGGAHPHPTLTRLSSKDFCLIDGAGKSTRLSDYTGKAVMVVFWSPEIPESLDVSILRNLQSHEQERLTVLAICIPPAPNCADEHEHMHGQGHEHAHHHHQVDSIASTPSQMQQLVKEKSHSANFTMLTDPEGALGRRFNVEDRPTYVLLDSKRMIRRRFIGIRTEPALRAMVEELRLESISLSANSR